MTPDEVKAIRERLGTPPRPLPAAALARALHLSSGRVVRHWEDGTRGVSDIYMLLLRYMDRYGLPETALGPEPTGKAEISPELLLLLRYFMIYGLPHQAGVRF